MRNPRKYYIDGPDGPETIETRPIHGKVVLMNGIERMFYCDSKGYFTLRSVPKILVRKRTNVQEPDKERREFNILLKHVMSKIEQIESVDTLRNILEII